MQLVSVSFMRNSSPDQATQLNNLLPIFMFLMWDLYSHRAFLLAFIVWFFFKPCGHQMQQEDVNSLRLYYLDGDALFFS